MAALQQPVGGFPFDTAASRRSFTDVLAAKLSPPSQPAYHPYDEEPLKLGLHKGQPAAFFTDAQLHGLSGQYSWSLVGKFSQGFNKSDPKKGRPSLDNLHRYFLSLDFKGEFEKRTLFSLASLIGHPLRCDGATTDLKRPSVARIQVELDLLKPRPDQIWIGLGEHDGYWQTIEYEFLPDYCQHCWHVGHSEASCRIQHPELQVAASQQKMQPRLAYVPKFSQRQVSQDSPAPSSDVPSTSHQQQKSTLSVKTTVPVSAVLQRLNQHFVPNVPQADVNIPSDVLVPSLNLATSPAPLPAAAAVALPVQPAAAALVTSSGLPLVAQEIGFSPVSLMVSSPVAAPISLSPVHVADNVSPVGITGDGLPIVDVVLAGASLPVVDVAHQPSVVNVGPSLSDSEVDEVFDVIDPPTAHGVVHPKPVDNLDSAVDTLASLASPNFSAPVPAVHHPASVAAAVPHSAVTSSASSLQATYKDVLLDSSLQGVVAQEIGLPLTPVAAAAPEHDIVVSQADGHVALDASFGYNDNDYYPETLGSDDLGHDDYEDTEGHNYEDITDGSEGTHLKKKKDRQKLKGLAKPSATMDDFAAQSRLIDIRIRKRGRPPGSRNRTYFDVQRTMSTRTTKSTSD